MRSAHTYTQVEGRSTRKVICFIPCCGSKYASGNLINTERELTPEDLPNTCGSLIEGRKGMQHCIDSNSPLTSAIHLYTGSPYDTFIGYKEEIIRLIFSGQLRLIILSAGYGIADALEPLHNYNAEMKGKVALHWRDVGLVDVISDFIIAQKPSCVFGFFAGIYGWSTSSSKYRYFFTEGVMKALKNDLDVGTAGCFYRREGRGVKAILNAIGRTFIEFMRTGFDESYALNIYEKGRMDGNVQIGFDKFRAAFV